MDESLCRVCRWWKKGLKTPEYGVCRHPDLNLYLTGSGCGFSPHENFGCSLYERSVEWAEDAAEEIDDWYQGAYTTLPEDHEERIRMFSGIILRHMDAHGAQTSNPSKTGAAVP